MRLLINIIIIHVYNFFKLLCVWGKWCCGACVFVYVFFCLFSFFLMCTVVVYIIKWLFMYKMFSTQPKGRGKWIPWLDTIRDKGVNPNIKRLSDIIVPTLDTARWVHVHVDVHVEKWCACVCPCPCTCTYVCMFLFFLLFVFMYIHCTCIIICTCKCTCTCMFLLSVFMYNYVCLLFFIFLFLLCIVVYFYMYVHVCKCI